MVCDLEVNPSGCWCMVALALARVSVGARMCDPWLCDLWSDLCIPHLGVVMKGFCTKHYVVTEIKDQRRFRGQPARMPRLEDGRRGNIGGLYKCVANWLIRNGVKTIAGPVCSGSVMAYAISAASGGKIQPVFLGKENGTYRPAMHSSECEITPPYVLVDDVIDSGKEIAHSLHLCRLTGCGDPMAALFLSIFAGRDRVRGTLSNIPVFEMMFRGE